MIFKSIDGYIYTKVKIMYQNKFVKKSFNDNNDHYKMKQLGKKTIDKVASIVKNINIETVSDLLLKEFKFYKIDENQIMYDSEGKKIAIDDEILIVKKNYDFINSCIIKELSGYSIHEVLKDERVKEIIRSTYGDKKYPLTHTAVWPDYFGMNLPRTDDDILETIKLCFDCGFTPMTINKQSENVIAAMLKSFESKKISKSICDRMYDYMTKIKHKTIRSKMFKQLVNKISIKNFYKYLPYMAWFSMIDCELFAKTFIDEWLTITIECRQNGFYYIIAIKAMMISIFIDLIQHPEILFSKNIDLDIIKTILKNSTKYSSNAGKQIIAELKNKNQNMIHTIDSGLIDYFRKQDLKDIAKCLQGLKSEIVKQVKEYKIETKTINNEIIGAIVGEFCNSESFILTNIIKFPKIGLTNIIHYQNRNPSYFPSIELQKIMESLKKSNDIDKEIPKSYLEFLIGLIIEKKVEKKTEVTKKIKSVRDVLYLDPLFKNKEYYQKLFDDISNLLKSRVPLDEIILTIIYNSVAILSDYDEKQLPSRTKILNQFAIKFQNNFKIDPTKIATLKVFALKNLDESCEKIVSSLFIHYR